MVDAQIEAPLKGPVEVRPKPTLEKEVIDGMREQGITGYFNNFDFLFPSSIKGGIGILDRRSYLEETGQMDKPLVESPTEADKKTHSLRYLDSKRTWRMFFRDVDNAVESSSLSLTQIQEERDKIYSPALEGRRQDPKESLFITLMPVYKRLRRAGYSHHDLTM